MGAAPFQPLALGDGADLAATDEPARSDPTNPGAGRHLAAIGAILIAGFGIVALVGPVIAAVIPGGIGFEGPSVAHPLGTDDLGRDLLGQLLAGARTSFGVGLVAAAIATALATVVGLTAGFLGGWVDRAIARALDVVLAIPFLPLVVVIGAYAGAGPITAAVVIGLTMSAHGARVVRSQSLEARGRGHVEAARAMGASFPWIARRHLLPIVLPLLVPQFVRAAGTAVIVEASLGFLGLGDPTVPSWGVTIAFAQARGALLTGAWLWWILPPGACIVALVSGFALFGFGLEERAQPRLGAWARHARRRTPSRADGPREAGGGASQAATHGHDRPLLEVSDLTVSYPARSGARLVLDGASFAVRRGEVIGIVGDSGAGKSTIAMALIGLSSSGARIERGSIRFEGRDLRDFGRRDLMAVRGDRIALVPQSAMHALDPVVDVQSQVAEVVRAHRRVPAAAAAERAAEVLQLVGIGEDRMGAFPHELSGGMRQRVVIAMAIANDPALLIADEPTTGLDVVIQNGIIELLMELQRRLGLAMVVVSHDLPVVLRLADRIVVLHDGKVVETGSAGLIARDPEHAVTRRLVAAVPLLSDSRGGR